MKRTGIVITSVVLLTALLAVSFLNRPAVYAQTPGTGTGERTIQVSGAGTAFVEPDMAVVVVGVRTEAEAASEALNQNNEQASELILTLQEEGVAQSDIQTQQISLFPRYSDQPNQGDQPEITGYIATNTVQVRVRNISQVGTILDAAVQNGSNLIENIRFEVSDQAEALQQAREAAFTNAGEKAQQLADLAGVQIGQVVSIVETSSSTPPIPFDAGGRAVAEMAVPVEPGSQSIQVFLQVTWEITGGQVGIPRTGTPGVPVTGTQTAPTVIGVTITPVANTATATTEAPAATATATETEAASTATVPVVDVTPLPTDDVEETPPVLDVTPIVTDTPES